jgi:hypothetical protein
MKIRLDGFEDLAEARAAAQAFLRETATKKKVSRGPRHTYADSYEPTSAQLTAPRRSWRRPFAPRA